VGWFPARILLTRPGTSALAVVALALGIGLTTTMFSIVHGVFLRGLPVERPDRILAVGGYDRRQAGTPRPGSLRLADYLEVRTAQRSFEDIGGTATARGDLVGPDRVPVRYAAARLTTNAPAVLRVQPILGRGFTGADGRPGAERVVLIGETVWDAQFKRDPDIVGTVVRANGEPATIIGVMPASFGFPEHELVWFPFAMAATAERSADAESLVAFGRLRDGVSVAEANAELAAIAARLEAAHPENKDRGIAAVPYIEAHIPGRTQTTFWTMLAAVFGVLLIACVNVANLQLARAADRTREIAIRLALGASRGRLVRQLLVEGLLLSAAGALLGLALARVALTLIWGGINDPTAPYWIRFEIDPAVLLFATGLTVFAAVASSLVPALRATRAAPNDVMKDEGRGSTGLRLGRVSRALVVAQVALSFGLLMASGLVIKSIVNTSVATLPFRTDVLTGRLDLSGPAYTSDDALREVLDRIQQRVASLPGVSGVTFANGVPGFAMSPIEIEGQPLPAEPLLQPRAEILLVAPNYPDLMRLPVVSGRGLRPSDRRGSELVALVSEDFAARYLPNEPPVGRRFRIGRARAGAPPPPWVTIVGTVPSLGGLSGNPREFSATAIVPLDQRPTRYLDIVVAGASGDVPAAGFVRRAVAEIDDTIVVDRMATVQARYDERLWPYRVFGGLFSAFGVAAMLLASAGLYGVMAFAVRRRTAEIGIRMALGADQPRILRMILRQGIVLLAIGVAIGAGIGALLSAQLTQLLYNVQPWDVPVLLTTFVALTVSGLAASLVPARRAAAVDPLVALRTE
jgi:predicted permease